MIEGFAAMAIGFVYSERDRPVLFAEKLQQFSGRSCPEEFEEMRDDERRRRLRPRCWRSCFKSSTEM